MSTLDNDSEDTEQSDTTKHPTRMGRQKGAVSFYSQKSVQKLRQLGFDPIEKMVDLYQKITKEIEKMDKLNTNNTAFTTMTGERRTRFSGVAYANLIAIQQKIIADLMRYGYARVSETIIMTPQATAPLTIMLTKEGDVFQEAAFEEVEYEEDE